MDKHATPAPCGLVCRTCRHIDAGCAGCLDDGGEADCPVRTCAAGRGLPGCWACDDLPCEVIAGMDPAWRGLTEGMSASAREHGPAEHARLALAHLGEGTEYGDLRFKDAGEIRRIVAGDPGRGPAAR